MSVKILHVITTLEIAGAENMLLKLLQSGTREEFDPGIVSLMAPSSTAAGTLAARAAALRVASFTLGLAQGSCHVAGLWRLWRIVRTAAPDLVQGWMYHGNLAASDRRLLSLRHRPPVIWNVRHSLHDLAHETC